MLPIAGDAVLQRRGEESSRKRRNDDLPFLCVLLLSAGCFGAVVGLMVWPFDALIARMHP
jgi:hypothetical protein